jgi:hypothetical protein
MSISKMVMGAVGVVVGMAAVSGYAATASERSVASMMDTKKEVRQAYGQVTMAVNALDKIMKAQVGDLRPLYKDFVSEVDALRSAAESARSRALRMKEKNRAYFASWAQDVDNITNPTIKSQSLARYKASLASCQKVEQLLVQTREAYVPLLSGLNDLQLSMNQDLTAPAIAALRPHYGKARQKAIDLQTIMKNTMSAIDDAAKQMNPTATGSSM